MPIKGHNRQRSSCAGHHYHYAKKHIFVLKRGYGRNRCLSCCAEGCDRRAGQGIIYQTAFLLEWSEYLVQSSGDWDSVTSEPHAAIQRLAVANELRQSSPGPQPLGERGNRIQDWLPSVGSYTMDTGHSLQMGYRHRYLVAKRVLDPLIALVLLVFLTPAMAVIALLIRLDSVGPAIFAQTRIGKGGRPFRMFKFRTMFDRPRDLYHMAFMRAFVRGQVDLYEKEGSIYKPSLGSEVTRVGKLLRKTSLDELPQLINVIKGDMSLIGPRPNVPWEVEEYQEWHMERLEVLPGITGLAQVSGRSGIDFDTIVRYDIEYAKNQSLGLDLQIIWKTFATVLDGKGVK